MLNEIFCLPKSMKSSYSKNKYFLYQSDRVFTRSKMEAANKDCKLSHNFRSYSASNNFVNTEMASLNDLV